MRDTLTCARLLWEITTGAGPAEYRATVAVGIYTQARTRTVRLTQVTT